ncbi:RidA family protein [Ammonicoccus fulvus]|uniref:RidA family protein n=1 Tax=Ammonicoccus fulvus TaxID=3138240 RepID=A0ABZ3FWX3_9ACTN
MSHTIVNPADLHNPVPFGYSHTAQVPGGAELVFVAGQYGSDAEGNVVSAEFADQVHQAFANVEAALAAHDLDFSHVVQLRTYVVGIDFEKLGVIGQAVGGRRGATPPTQTVIGIAGLAMPDILFEVEAVACR